MVVSTSPLPTGQGPAMPDTFSCLFSKRGFLFSPGHVGSQLLCRRASNLEDQGGRPRWPVAIHLPSWRPASPLPEPKTVLNCRIGFWLLLVSATIPDSNILPTIVMELVVGIIGGITHVVIFNRLSNNCLTVASCLSAAEPQPAVL